MRSSSWAITLLSRIRGEGWWGRSVVRLKFSESAETAWSRTSSRCPGTLPSNDYTESVLLFLSRDRENCGRPAKSTRGCPGSGHASRALDRGTVHADEGESSHTTQQCLWSCKMRCTITEPGCPERTGKRRRSHGGRGGSLVVFFVEEVGITYQRQPAFTQSTLLQISSVCAVKGFRLCVVVRPWASAAMSEPMWRCAPPHSSVQSVSTAPLGR